MTSPVEEIKNRVDIVDFIGNYVQLKRAGTNFSARCPFHSEKTPSFMVSRSKQLWYCFGACQEGGDVFKFLMKIEGLDFPEALKILADKAGVLLPKYDKQAESKKNTLFEIMKSATAFYTSELHGPRGVLAREYLKTRGLSEAVIKQFALGYAPDSWDALTTALRDKFKAEDVFAAGLTIRSERTQGFYDRFRHRIIFPIRDVHGNAVGCTSRLLDEKRAEGKYINTPETLMYNKSRVLYGLDLARDAVRRQDYAVVVEGNMDVIACHQFGMGNVVAASGTALTLDQVRLLKRYTNNLKIAFDADPAGESAAKRGIDLALSEGMQIKVITLPKECGKDPDECVRKDIKAWEDAVRRAKEIMEYYVEKARARFNIDHAQGRSQFVNTLLVEVIKLPDLIEQDFWLKKIGEMVKVDERLLREQMQRLSKWQRAHGKEHENELSVLGSKPLAKPRLDLLSDRLLALFLRDDTDREQIVATILPDMLAPLQNQTLYTQLVACYTAYNSQGSALAGADFRHFWRTWALSKAKDVLSTADILELYGDREFSDWDKVKRERETQFLIHELRRENDRARRATLAHEMREAERAGDRDRVEKLTREFESLLTHDL